MDGRTVWINLSVALTWKPDGMADYFIFTFEDITERKRIEAALRESERRYRLIAENTSDVIWLLDLTLDRFTYVSPSVERLFGLTSEVVVGLKMHQVLLPETYRTVSENLRTRVAHFEAGAESLRISTGNLDQLRKDGSFVSTEVVTTLITDESGRVNMIMGISRDISERKRAEASLKKSEERYRLIAENTSDVIWLVDIPSDRFTYVSPSVERLRGYTSEEVMGQTMEQVLPPEAYRLISKTLPGRIAQFQAGDETQRTTTRNVDQLRKNGSTVSTEVATTLIMNENGRVAMILGVSRDITERRHAEEEKEKLQDQLLQAQKMESVGRLAGGVAHDFNNMLGVILGHVELAMDHVSPGHPLHADLQGIMKAAEHSADLTHQLLAFARKQVISPEVINLNKTVEGMLKMMRRLIGEDIQLDWQPEANLWSVKMDPSQIDQILANLCVNARDAITGVGKITAETGNITFNESYCADHAGFLPGGFVLLAMSDDGCGMDKEVIDKLFEPFFTTKEMEKGTGLGLATVYGIVHQNNGFINVYSEPGQGTTFRIYLPRFAGINEHARIAESQAVAVRGHETILVVEDELEILNLARYMLERQGYQVLTAGRPGAAIRLAGNYAGEIHLLLTDVVMPEMNGRELANKMLSLYPNLKCLFMSGYTANIIALQGILDEGMHFIQKPFSRNDLAAKVRETLDQKSNIEDGSI